MDFVAYHDRTGADHQAHFNTLYPQGFRMISLSVYQRSSPLYAAVWVRRDGPDWSAVHGVDGAGYQAAFNAAAAAGFHPVILSAAGPAANPVFAGVFEQRPGPIPLTRFGLTSGTKTDPGTIQHWDDQAHANGWIMTCGAVSDDERYLSIFADDQIGPWIARHGLTSMQYQAEFDRLVPLGFYPVCVQGGGSGSGIRFAIIFARQEEPLSRRWTTVGVGHAPAVDQVMQETLEASNVRGAAVAVTDNTRLVFARGYTWAEPGYPAVQPTTVFRLASVSKAFAGVAAHQLIAAGRLRLTDSVQGILNLMTPTGGAPPVG